MAKQMADPTPTEAPPPAEPAAAADGAEPLGWSRLWQMPVLLLGLILLGVWFYATLTTPRQKNDFNGGLDSVAQYLKANNFEGARNKINEILPHIKEATEAESARLKQLWGDTIYLEQRTADANDPENNKKIIELYTDSKQHGQAFDPQHLQWWAATLVAMGQEAEALKLVEELKGQPAATRYGVLKAMIERRRRSPNVKLETLAPLIARFQAEIKEETTAKRREQDLWLTGLQAQMMLDNNDPEHAVDELLRRINTLAGTAGEGDLAPLMVTLAKAYQRVGENTKARSWYQRAQPKLPAADPVHADILVGLGQIELAESGDVRAALDDFAAAQSQYPPSSPAYFDALLGRADCEARLGDREEATDYFNKAVRYVLDLRTPSEERKTLVFNTIQSNYEASVERDDYEAALEYLELLPPLYQRQPEWPAKVLLEFASSHEKIAEKLTATVKKPVTSAAPTTQPGQTAKSKEEKRAAGQAAIHLGKAGDFYMRHAHAVALPDDTAYAQSLWKAAECYDKAQLWKKAIDSYTEFVKNRPGDPRQLTALLQLGLAYQADQQYVPAIDRLKLVIDTQPRSPEAYNALVPLAQCYESSNDMDAAKRVLTYVTKDHPTITPDSKVYKDALIELGKLYYKLGEYKEAIERLQLAVDHYKDTTDAAEIRYRLADAYRRSVEDLDKDLLEPMPQSKKLAIQAERARRLDVAQGLFTQVIVDYDARPNVPRTPVEELFYRNAHFYRGDCAYDLQRFEQAIQLYDIAAKRFESHPSALVALVQIVNAYCELGRVQEAKVANLRARALLKRIPDEAFKDPSLPMTRAHWEDWLRWTSELDLFKSSANAE